MDKYNAQQKRSDRKIKDYYQRVLDDGRFGKTKTLKRGNREKTVDTSRKPIYEFYSLLGNRNMFPDPATAKEILRGFFMDVWPEKFGRNFVLVRVDYHDDEYSQDSNGDYTVKSPPHVHAAFVPVVHKSPEDLKQKGVLKMETQHSLSQACEQAGFKTDHLTPAERDTKKEIKEKIKEAKKDGDRELVKQLQEQLEQLATYTSQQRFEEAVRFALAEYAESRGLKIDMTPGKRHGHMSKEMYQISKERETLATKENELSQKSKDISEREAAVSSDKTIIAEQKARLQEQEDTFAKRKQEAEDRLEADRISLNEEKERFDNEKESVRSEHTEKAAELSNKENEINDKAAGIEKKFVDIKKSVESNMKDFAVDEKTWKVLGDSPPSFAYDSSAEKLEKKFPIRKEGFTKKESHFEYCIRVISTLKKDLWKFAKKSLSEIQEKYKSLQVSLNNAYYTIKWQNEKITELEKHDVRKMTVEKLQEIISKRQKKEQRKTQDMQRDFTKDR